MVKKNSPRWHKLVHRVKQKLLLLEDDGPKIFLFNSRGLRGFKTTALTKLSF